MGRLRGKLALFGAASGLQAYPPHGARASRQRRRGGAIAVVDVCSANGSVAAVYDRRTDYTITQILGTHRADSATGNRCPTRRLVRHRSQIRERNSTLVPLHYDLSRVAGLGELDGFFELLKWKVMGDDR